MQTKRRPLGRLAFSIATALALGFGAVQAAAAADGRDPCDGWYGTCASQEECAAICGAGAWSFCDGRGCCQCEFP